MDNWKFHIVTFGCKINQYETQAIRESWIKAGGIEAACPQEAAVILVNSCAITGKAERDTRNAVARLRDMAPHATLILTGCAAQFYEKFTPRHDARLVHPDICITQSDKWRLLGDPRNVSQRDEAKCAWRRIDSYKRSRPVIKIQDGCSQFCAYCIVPYTRGKPVSRGFVEILAECRNLCSKGFGELVLSGINLRQYKGGFWQALAELDRKLFLDFGHSIRLRLSSLDPSMLDSTGISTLLNTKLVCHHLHLSLQHSSSAVLNGMRRGHYSGGQIKGAVAELTHAWGMMALGADIIAGFPGETREDVEDLLQFIKELPFTYGHVFPFSARRGTLASRMPEQIPRKEKARRARVIRDLLQSKQQLFINKQLLLKKVMVAPEITPSGPDRGINEYYTPCAFIKPTGQASGLIAARPVAARNGQLLVEPLVSCLTGEHS